MYWKRLILFVTFVVLGLTTGCAGLFSSNGQTPAPEVTNLEATATLAAPADVGAPILETPHPAESDISTATPTAVATAVEGVYLINRRATSDRGALTRIHLVLYQAALTNDSFILRIGFQNSGDESLILTGGNAANAFRLVDAAGVEYQPLNYSENLARVAPPGNFTPGQANVGDLVFPLPAGPAPYELHFPTYDPLVFELNHPATITAQPVPEGTYLLDIELYSGQRVLAPIRLKLETVTVTSAELIFEVSFINTRRQGYTLLQGPTGGDVRLLDAENAAYEPARVSDNLAANIAPEEGWLPGQAHTGQIVFLRPQRMEQVRFVFPQYAAATLQFDASGLANAALTSAAGAPPPPTPTPAPDEVAFRELDDLLAQQAQAMLTGDLDAYLATFAPELHEEQRTIFERGRQLPFSDYWLAVSPGANLSPSNLQAGHLRRVTVQTRYHFRDTPEDNPFQHETLYEFEQRNGRWIVSDYSLTGQPPFWWNGDVIVQETPHFLLIARPEMSGEMDQLAQECEQAYSDLLALGLNLEPRIVAYFTATQADFNAQTGQGSRVLGVALSLYDLSGEQIQTLGRAFYINGQAFQEETDETGPFGRLATTRHELVHLALAKETRPFTPPWVVEGAAVYYAGQNRPESRRLLVEEGNLEAISLARLTGAGTLGAHDLLGQRVGYEYIFSAEVARYLIETYGEEAFMAFYRFFTHVPAADVRDRMPMFAISSSVSAAFANLSQELTAEALNDIYGLTIEGLDTAVKEWLWEQYP